MASQKGQSRSTSREGKITHMPASLSSSSFETEVQIECNRLSEQIASIPAVVRDRLSKAEEASNGKAYSDNSNHDLIYQIRRAEQQVQRRDATIQHLKAELDACKLEVQRLHAKEQSLRNFMQESESYHEPNEQEVITAFVGVRQKIQKLVSSRAYQVDGKGLCAESNVFTVSKDVASLWQRATPPNRKLILRALIYKCLVDEVLNYRFFGTVEPKMGDKASTCTVDGVVSGLSHFEHILEENKVSHDIVTNWRLSTMRSVEAVGLAKGPYGTQLAEEIYDYFSTFLVEEATTDDKHKLLQGFIELCHEAHVLCLLMRKSKVEYMNIAIVSDARDMAIENYADVFGELEGARDGRSAVNLTLFGALGARNRNSTDGIRLLERAQVITTRK